MELYIMQWAKHYSGTDEMYQWASVHRSRKEAEEAMIAEMRSHLDTAGIEDDEDTTEDEQIKIAIERGEADEAHDAVLVYSDCEMYVEIRETTVTVPVFVAAVQVPLQSLDCMPVEVFTDCRKAEAWRDAKLADDAAREGFGVEEMNHEIYEREV